MGKLTVALLSGGISSEREVSINSGNQVFEALDKEKYNVIRYDPKDDIPKLVSEAANIDVALIILHGPFGEDGTIQGLLDLDADVAHPRKRRAVERLRPRRPGQPHAARSRRPRIGQTLGQATPVEPSKFAFLSYSASR